MLKNSTIQERWNHDRLRGIQKTKTNATAKWSKGIANRLVG